MFFMIEKVFGEHDFAFNLVVFGAQLQTDFKLTWSQILKIQNEETSFMPNWNKLLFAGKLTNQEWLFTNLTTLRNSPPHLPYLSSESRGQVRVSRPDLRRVSQVEYRAQPRSPYPFFLSPLYVCSIPSSCSITEKTKDNKLRPFVPEMSVSAEQFGLCSSSWEAVCPGLTSLTRLLTSTDTPIPWKNVHSACSAYVRRNANAASTSQDVKWRDPEDLNSSPLQENFMFPNIYS